MGLKQPSIRKPRPGWMINSPYLEMYLMQERRRFLWVPNGNLVMVNLKVYQNRIIPQALYVVVVNLKCSLKKKHEWVRRCVALLWCCQEKDPYAEAWFGVLGYYIDDIISTILICMWFCCLVVGVMMVDYDLRIVYYLYYCYYQFLPLSNLFVIHLPSYCAIWARKPLRSCYRL